MGLAIGDRVFGIVGGGAQAEYLRVPAAHCARVPAGLDLVAMGGVPEAFVTAHDALVTHAHVAAASGCSSTRSAVASAPPACSSPRRSGPRSSGPRAPPSKLDRCRPLGLDAGIVAGVRTTAASTVDALAAQIVEQTPAASMSCSTSSAATTSRPTSPPRR